MSVVVVLMVAFHIGIKTLILRGRIGSPALTDAPALVTLVKIITTYPEPCLVGTITKALELLDLFSERRPELSLADLTRLSGADKATLLRYLAELQDKGFIDQMPLARTYRLGPALLRLAAVRERTHPIHRAVKSAVGVLADGLGEFVHASELQGAALSPLCHSGMVASVRAKIAFDIAEMLPLHATAAGHTVLAFGPAHLLEDTLRQTLPAFTRRTPVEPESLQAAIHRVRRLGHAELEGTYSAGVIGFAVAFFDDQGIARGAIAVTVPILSFQRARTIEIVEALRRESRNVTTSIGGRSPRLAH